jgi:predicted transcriptional regulator
VPRDQRDGSPQPYYRISRPNSLEVTIKLLGELFSMRSVPRHYRQDESRLRFVESSYSSQKFAANVSTIVEDVGGDEADS